MHCRNCGGAMKLVADHRIFECGYCGAHQDPERSPDGVQILEEPTGAPCPVCELELVSGHLAGRTLEVCTRCRGLLLARRDFLPIVQWERAHYDGPKLQGPPVAGGEHERTLACPKCEGEMSAEPYLGPGAVVFDTCGGCDLLWLDRGELGRIVRSGHRF